MFQFLNFRQQSRFFSLCRWCRRSTWADDRWRELGTSPCEKLERIFALEKSWQLHRLELCRQMLNQLVVRGCTFPKPTSLSGTDPGRIPCEFLGRVVSTSLAPAPKWDCYPSTRRCLKCIRWSRRSQRSRPNDAFPVSNKLPRLPPQPIIWDVN